VAQWSDKISVNVLDGVARSNRLRQNTHYILYIARLRGGSTVNRGKKSRSTKLSDKEWQTFTVSDARSGCIANSKWVCVRRVFYTALGKRDDLSVCLSARISQEPHVRASPNFLRTLPTAVTRSSCGSAAMPHVLPVLWMRSGHNGQEWAARNSSSRTCEYTCSELEFSSVHTLWTNLNSRGEGIFWYRSVPTIVFLSKTTNTAVSEPIIITLRWRLTKVTKIAVTKSKKIARPRFPSVGFRSWSRFLAVSLQVTWVKNPAVGCHYFPPGP